MSLFKCSKCGCIENTATSDYWHQIYTEKQPPLCSECQTGVWHGIFEKKTPEEWGLMKQLDGFYGNID